MAREDRGSLEQARKLMDDFAHRTGLTGEGGDIERRYLWTDAFAVQSFFGLAHACGDELYRERALKLIDLVHQKLGRFHRSDPRRGWISGLPEEEGEKHPTAGGLRIGKKMPERQAGEPFSERLEWERDGQYFHYISRWINTLLQAHLEIKKQNFSDWAAELLQAGGKFIDRSDGRIRMYWKMSVDLSRPLVPSMGAHDPLEGLICAESARVAAPRKDQEMEPLAQDFAQLCAGRDWSTTDSLGIGGLLLNTVRAAKLSMIRSGMMEEVRPEKLLDDSLAGLQVYSQMHQSNQAAKLRLAFRECGLSLGLRALYGLKDKSAGYGLILEDLERFVPLADEIEGFWLDPDNQAASTWSEHLDINEVSLASSLVAIHYPFAFLGVPDAS